KREQERCKEFKSFHVMELTATTRSDAKQLFELTDEEKNPPEKIPDPKADESPIHHIWRRLKATKRLYIESTDDAGKIADRIAELALQLRKDEQGDEANAAVLVFVRTIDDVKKVFETLTNKKDGISSDRIRQLTGTMRGLE